ncbi:MAG TPA: glycosyltransferase family 2 protein [Candidatus Sulfotelmatobacter sp.]|nr:glycosyltransferase family 2 protein [Candidatus Sulfotelmatobacter sp.]
MQLSVVIITFNEEANIGRTLASVQPLVANGQGEIIVVDSGSTDRTVEIAKSFGAKVFIEDWKGYAGQKNSAIDKAEGEWILSLDADEEVERDLAGLITFTISERKLHPRQELLSAMGTTIPRCDASGFWIQRRNLFLGRWIKHGGFWPDPKLRLFRRGSGRFENRTVHEDVAFEGKAGRLDGALAALLHHSYPTLSDYIEHMNRYSSLGAEMVVAKGKVHFSFINIVLRPLFTFIYNYFFRLGFLDGREGLLLHLYHAVYVSWKYAKAWELSRKPNALSS